MADEAAAETLRRAEETGFNGWPALRQIVYDGWLLRFAEGHTRRSNSVNLLRDVAADDEKVAACEALFRAQGLPTIFRLVRGAAPALERALDRHGYTADEAETCILHCGDLSHGAAPDPAVLFEPQPGAAWIEAWGGFHGHDADVRDTYRRIVGALAVPAAFARLTDARGRVVAVAYAALHDRMMGLNSVIADPGARRQGHARRLVASLMAWAQAQGAKDASLSVEAANAPASALYRALGFKELARYQYRRKAL